MEFVAERSGEIGKAGNMQRLNAIDAERIDVLSVVGVGESRRRVQAQAKSSCLPKEIS